MNTTTGFNYKTEANRYSFYYQRIQRFYAKPVTQVSVAVLFTIMTIVFFAAFAIKPTLETVSELLKKIEDQKEVLQKAEQKVSALGSAQQQLEQIMPYQATLDAAFPVTPKIQELVKQIEWLAGTNGIPISSFSVSGIQYPEPKANEMKEILFTVQFEANYQTIKNFLNGLYTLPRLISVEQMSFDVGENPSGTNSNLMTTFRCKAYINAQGK